jgi:O-antigen/teichoic acid export membrane protein
VIGRYVAGGTLWLLAAIFFQQITGFAAAFAALKIADVAVYGSLVFLVSWAAIPVAFVSQGMPQAATHFLARYLVAGEREEAANVLARIRWLVVGAGVAFVFVVPLLLRLLPESIFSAFDPVALSVLFAAAVVLRSLLDVQGQASLGIKNPRQSAAIESFVPQSVRLLAILAILPLVPTAAGILLCHVLALALAVAFAESVLARSGFTLRLPRAPVRASLFRFGWPLMGAEVLAVVVFHADKIVLGYLAGPAEVGAYGVASRLAFLVPAAHWASGRTLAPVIAELWVTEQIGLLKLTYQRFAQLLLVITGFAGALVIANANWVLPLFGQAFKEPELVTVVQVLVVGLCATVLVGHQGQLYRMTGKTKVPTIITALGAGLNVGLNLLLIPRMGLLGAAWATAIAFMAMHLFGVLLLPSTFGGRVHPFGKGYLASSAAAGAMLGGAILAGGDPIVGNAAALLFGAAGLVFSLRRFVATG